MEPGLLDETPEPASIVDGVACRPHDYLTEVVLARPEVHNALNLAMWKRLGVVFHDFARMPDLRVVVVRGAGGRAFSAGADIAEFRARRVGVTAAREYNSAVAATLEAIRDTPQTVVAMVSGPAVGGGCEICTMCDLRLAAHTAKLGIPIKRLGVTLGRVEAAGLVALIGPARAKDLLLTGRLVSAEEALKMGLVDRVFPADQLPQATWSLAREIASGAPRAMVTNKLTINTLVYGPNAGDEQRLEQLTADVYGGSDLLEGITAFLEKRDPEFTGG
jgi:enoyl-CoA hydratase